MGWRHKVQLEFDLFEDQRREGMFPLSQNIHLERKKPDLYGSPLKAKSSFE